MPNASVVPLKGKTPVQLSDFRGKVLVLDFWATWCGPCREMMPGMEGLYNTYRDKGVQILAISNEERSVVERFKAGRAETYPVYLDTNQEANKQYEVVAYPTIVVIDRQGKVVFLEVTNEVSKVEQAVQKALRG